jgi:hypothetical protein
VTRDELYLLAVAACQAGGWRCTWCYSCDVGSDLLPSGAHMPWIRHTASPVTGGWCPCLSDRDVNRQISLDLLDRLAVLMDEFSLPARGVWHRRERVTA